MQHHGGMKAPGGVTGRLLHMCPWRTKSHTNTSWYGHFCLKFKFIWYMVCFAELGNFFLPAAVAHLPNSTGCISTSTGCILGPLWEFCNFLGYFLRQYLALWLFWTLALPISGPMLLVISCFTPISLLVTGYSVEKKGSGMRMPKKIQSKNMNEF